MKSLTLKEFQLDNVERIEVDSIMIEFDAVRGRELSF